MDLYDELQWRGMLYDSTDGVREALGAGRVTGYIGFDPTAASLHVGSLLTILGLSPSAAVGACGDCRGWRRYGDDRRSEWQIPGARAAVQRRDRRQRRRDSCAARALPRFR